MDNFYVDAVTMHPVHAGTFADPDQWFYLPAQARIGSSKFNLTITLSENDTHEIIRIVEAATRRWLAAQKAA